MPGVRFVDNGVPTKPRAALIPCAFLIILHRKGFIGRFWLQIYYLTKKEELRTTVSKRYAMYLSRTVWIPSKETFPYAKNIPPIQKSMLEGRSAILSSNEKKHEAIRSFSHLFHIPSNQAWESHWFILQLKVSLTNAQPLHGYEDTRIPT